MGWRQILQPPKPLRVRDFESPPEFGGWGRIHPIVQQGQKEVLKKEDKAVGGSPKVYRPNPKFGFCKALQAGGLRLY